MEDETIRIVNPIQEGAYFSNGLEPLKIYWSIDKWVWLFDNGLKIMLSKIVKKQHTKDIN